MSVDVVAMIGGQPFPLTRFTTSGASHGNVGHAEITTSLVALDAAGVDPVALSVNAPNDLPVDIYVTEDGERRHIFGGEFVSGAYSYGSDMAVLHARDWAGPLVDQKRVLTSLVGGSTGALAPDESSDSSGVSSDNQKLSQIVTSIAKQFSLTADLRLAQGAEADPQVGALFGDTTNLVLSPTPQPLWGILTRLARLSGNVVYATPDKHLVFGAPGAGLETLAFTWRLNPRPPGTFPLLSLALDHNPRRNQTFRVMVLSYDPTTQQTTQGQAYVIGGDYSTDQGGKVHAGAWSGQQASAIQAAIGTGKQSGKNAIQLYTFHVDGLTQSQANQRAQAIASDIARREIVAKLASNGIPEIQPSQPATLAGEIADEFAAHTYYVTGFSHHFSMGLGEGANAEYRTDVMLLDRQPEGTGAPVSAKGGAT